MRRFLCILIACVILLSCCPVAYAAEEAADSAMPAQLQAGENAITHQGDVDSGHVEAPVTSDDFVDSGADPKPSADGQGTKPADVDEAEATTLLHYRGDGMFQAGSFKGPQSAALTQNTFALSPRTLNSEQLLYNDISDAMRNATPQNYAAPGGGSAYCIYIDISEYGLPSSSESMDAVYMVYARAVNDDPDLFYFVPNVYFGESGSPAVLTGLYIIINRDIYPQRDSYLAEKAAVLQDVFPNGYSDMQSTEIALALHDYLAMHLVYHDEAAGAGSAAYDDHPNAFSAYGAIVDKKAVCHGLSLAYKALLADCGIEAYLVPDYQKSHVWNLVMLENGNWYHADVTNAMDNHSPVLNSVLHGRFLLSDAEQSRDYPKAEWSAENLPEAALSHPARAFWQDVTSGMFYMHGSWYYNNGSGGSGSLAKSTFGAKRSETKLYSNVSFPVRILDRLYFYDNTDGGIYAFSAQKGIRTMRGVFPEGLSDFGAGAALFGDSLVDYHTLFFSLANGSEWERYEKADLGDANADGSLDVLDILYLFEQKSGSASLSSASLPRAETVYDQFINNDDAQRIAEMIVGLAI